MESIDYKGHKIRAVPYQLANSPNLMNERLNFTQRLLN
jgi:hypothetical protein